MGYPTTLDGWMDFCGRRQQDEEDVRGVATAILDAAKEKGLLDGTEQDVIFLGCALWQDPPAVLSDLTPLQALSLAATAFASELVYGPCASDDDRFALAKRLRVAVTSVQRPGDDDTFDQMRQRAALAMLRQLGGASTVGLPGWMESAVGDTESWTACGHLLKRVELACQNTSPGRRSYYVGRIGFITYMRS